MGVPLVGVSSPPPGGEDTDQRASCPPVEDQSGSSQCEAEWLASANWQLVGLRGKKPSHRGLYVAARARERFRRTDPVPDAGCTTVDVVMAAIEVGLYPADAKDDQPDDKVAINDMATWDEALGLVKMPARCFVPVSQGDTAAMRVLLKQGPCNIGITLEVDVPFMDGNFGPVWQGLAQPSQGRHRMGIVGYSSTADAFIVRNSWGVGWCLQGYCLISARVIAEKAEDPVAVVEGVEIP